MHTNSLHELGLGGYMAILRRHWMFFIVPALIVPWAAFYLSSQQSDRFVATAFVLLDETAAEQVVAQGSQNASVRNRSVENELRFATSDAAAAEVARRFEAGQAPAVRINADNDSDVLEFRAVSDNAESAANIANAWAETYLALKQQQSVESIDRATAQLEERLAELRADRELIRADLVNLQDRLTRASSETRDQAQLLVDREENRIAGQVTLLDSQIAATAANLTDLALTADLALGAGPRLVTTAKPPTQRSNPPIAQNILLGLVLGCAAGVAAAFLRHSLNRSVQTAADLEQVGLTHLGSVPRSTRSAGIVEQALSSLEHPESPQAAAYQQIRSSLGYVSTQTGIDSVVITSAVQGEGKTSAAANLATAMAQAGKRTLLVDSDLRRPRLHKVFRTRQSPGLTNVVIDPPSIAESAWPIPALAESFVVLPAGALPPHPPTFLSSDEFGRATATLSDLCDFFIVDAAPILPVADTLSLIEHVPNVVVVVAAGRTKTDELRRTVTSLNRAGANVVGAILIGVRRQSKSYEYSAAKDELDWLSDDDLARSHNVDSSAVELPSGTRESRSTGMQSTTTPDTVDGAKEETSAEKGSTANGSHEAGDDHQTKKATKRSAKNGAGHQESGTRPRLPKAAQRTSASDPSTLQSEARLALPAAPLGLFGQTTQMNDKGLTR